MAYSNKEIELTKQRLEDLRNELHLTFEKLEQELEKKENYYITPASLSNYECNDKLKPVYKSTSRMSLERFVALADFYEVPIEYLLGRTSTRKSENLQLGKELNLSDEAIQNIHSIIDKDNKNMSKKNYVRRSNILSDLLSDANFLILVECIAKGKEYLEAQENFDFRCFIDSSGDYIEDEYYIKQCNQHDAHIIDCDYANTGEFYFYKATQMLNVVIHNLLSPYLLDRYMSPLPPILSPKECNKLLSTFETMDTDDK